MEFEQIVKRLEWLDNQQRENKEALIKLDERVNSFETTVNAVSKQIKALSKQMSDISPAAKRLEQFEDLLIKQREDLLGVMDEREKDRLKSEKDAAKNTQALIDDIRKSLAQLDKTPFGQDVKKQLKERANESQRFLNTLTELRTRVEEAARSNETAVHSLEAINEIRKNDLKRITDVQGELTSLRKRIDENREKTIVNADGIRNMENRISELLATESERRQSQATFLEQQSLAQLDRDRAWKEWKDKYDDFQKEAENIQSHVKELDETLRGARKAQESYVELNTKLERRINEITEMQRLAEDRLRQEWVSFKADDQKRWTGYSLSSEESFRDIRKDMQKMSETVTAMDDLTHTMQDQLHQTTDTTEKQLQELMNLSHEWMASYQRIMGHGKKPKKS
jgi:chromosome segregation ATPase